MAASDSACVRERRDRSDPRLRPPCPANDGARANATTTLAASAAIASNESAVNARRRTRRRRAPLAAAAASSASRAGRLASRNCAAVSGRPTVPCVRHSSAVASGVPRNSRSGSRPLRGPFGRGLGDPLTHAEIVTVLVDPRAESGPGSDERLVDELDAALVDGEQAARSPACRRRRGVSRSASTSSHESRRRVSGASSAGRHEPQEQPARLDAFRRRRGVRTRPRPTARSRRRRHPRRGTRRGSAPCRGGASTSPSVRAR